MKFERLKDKSVRMAKNIVLAGLTLGMFMSVVTVTSCSTGSNKAENEQIDTVMTDTAVINAKPKEKPVKEKAKKEKTDKKKAEEPKSAAKEVVEEAPKEIGASPDAVYSLDDNETETSPKYEPGDKAMKKLLKSQLRKAGKGEKATFRASIVVKSDGSVGRVDFTACGYNDDYKEDIKAAIRTLTFTPGTKNGVAVDSWYYINWKR